MIRITVLAAAVVAAAGLAASSAPGATGVSGPFVGVYEATLTHTQAAARGDSRMAGRFTLVLGSNGLYVAVNPFDFPSGGRYAVLPGNRLRFFDDVGCVVGGFERPGGGIYRWSAKADSLTLRLVKEGPCTGRTQSLTYPVWKRRI